MKILVTGGSGFVGLAIADRLLADGEAVTLADLRPPPPALAARLPASPSWLPLDICDRRATEEAVLRGGYDAVVHAAAVTPDPDAEWGEMDRIIAVNAGGAANALAAASAAGTRRIILIGSAAVYEGAEGAGPLDEEAPARPASLYGASKLLAEAAVLAARSERGCQAAIVRLGPVFGPYEHPSGSRIVLSPVHRVIDAARAGRRVAIAAGGAGDWIHSADAAAAVATLLAAPELPFAAYNVAGGSAWRLSDLCAELARRLGGFQWRTAAPGQRPDLAFHPARPPLSVARIGGAHGWRPALDLASAVADYLDWLDRPKAAA
jgi:nucleoside-diphosphate-sugar epimerase